MNLRTLLCKFVWAWGLCVGTLMAQTQSIEGRVLLSDSLHAASYASVYVPSTGQGTVCDKEGHFLLEGLNKTECPIEVSYMGYSTHKEVIRFDTASIVRLQVTMEEEPINLANVFITPNGEDAAVYLFNKVLQQSKANRKRLQHFDAVVHTKLHSQDMDFIPLILPKFLYFTLKTAMKVAGYGVMVDLCFKQPVVDVDIRYDLLFAKGKVQFKNEKVEKSTPALSEKEAKGFFKLCEYDPVMAPEATAEYCWKAAQKEPGKYKLVGSIEEQGHVVDILEHVHRHGDSISYSRKYYIIEDLWCLLRMETKDSDGSVTRLEFRNIGGDIYLPVNRVELPAPVPMDLEAMLTEVHKKIEEGKEKPSSMEKSIIKRMEEVVKSGRKFEPYMSENFSIQYNNVVINK